MPVRRRLRSIPGRRARVVGADFPTLLLPLGNPMIMVFFGSIFLSLLPGDLPGWMQAAVLAIVAFKEFAWFAQVALLGARPE